MAKATQLLHEKRQQDDGSIVELVIWKLPTPVLGSDHCYKYRLYFGNKGKRLVAYDNERGKGDHKHIQEIEYPYHFSTVDQLIQDFMRDIREANHDK